MTHMTTTAATSADSNSVFDHGMAATESRDFRSQFSRVSNARGAIDALTYWVAIVATFIVAHVLHHWAAYVVAVLLVGGLQHALITLQHDAWHRLAFRSRRINDLVGAWLYAYPVGMPFYHERRRHLAHHRHFGSPMDDPEWMNYTNEGRTPAARLWRFFVGRLCGSLLVSQAISILLRGEPRTAGLFAPAKRDPSPLAEYGRVAICQLVLLGGFAMAGAWWEYLLLWLLPLVTVASLFIALRAFVEHSHPHDTTSAEERLYDFRPGLMERFFVSPCHFNYHALHHSFPTIPHSRLPSAYEFARRRQIDYPGEPRGGYVVVLLDHVRRLDDSKQIESTTDGAVDRRTAMNE